MKDKKYLTPDEYSKYSIKFKKGWELRIRYVDEEDEDCCNYATEEDILQDLNQIKSLLKITFPTKYDLIDTGICIFHVSDIYYDIKNKIIEISLFE
jgi:hypothetical protein